MLYCICIISILVFSYLANKREKKLYVFLCALILSAFCGLRGVGTGIDTGNYIQFMSLVRSSGIFYGSDIGFSAISYLLMKLFKNPYYPLTVFATFTNFLIVYRLWDFEDKASYPFMMVVYMAFYYTYEFSIVRQFLAISLLFWATRYIESKQYVKYFLFNALASTIHTSSLICFSYLFITFGQKARKTQYKVLSFATAAMFVIGGMYIFSNNITKYEGYFASTSSSIHVMTIIKILFLFMVLVFNRPFTNMQISISKSGEIVPMDRQIPIIYGIGLLMAVIGMKYTFMNRIGFYFMMFEMPFWGQVFNVKINRSLYRSIMVCIVLYFFVTSYLQGDTPDNLFRYQSFLGQ